MTVGSAAARESVVCPQCGKSVPLNGAAERDQPLTFAVRRVADDKKEKSNPEAGTIRFRCPGCDKEFHESPQAAGKQTECPQCETGFVIPRTCGPPLLPTLQPVDDSVPEIATEAHQASEDAVEAAVAAYKSGRDPMPNGKWRIITPQRMVPIGLLLIFVGGATAIVGTVFASKTLMQSLSLGNLGDGGGLEQGNGLDAQDLPRLLQQLGKSQSSGQGMLIGGVIAGGIGSLLTFIGGIFLLAGLIGRFIEKPAE